MTEIRVGETTADMLETTDAESHYLDGTLSSEADHIETFIDEARPDDVFWDVGSNAGFYTALVGQHVGHVVAIDPIIQNADHCHRNARENGVSATVLPIALGEDTRMVLVDVERRGDVAGAGRSRIDPGGDTPVLQATADDLLDWGVPAPNLLKIDAEASELRIIDGMERTIQSVRYAYVEPHDGSGEAIRERISAYTFVKDGSAYAK